MNIKHTKTFRKIERTRMRSSDSMSRSFDTHADDLAPFVTKWWQAWPSGFGRTSFLFFKIPFISKAFFKNMEG